MTERKSNAELIKLFKHFLAHGFYIEDEQGEPHLSGEQHEAGLRATKAWRSDLWSMFREIENRLDPLAELAKVKNGNKSKTTA